MGKIYHVARKWDGGDLTPLALQYPEDLEAGLVEAIRHWPDCVSGCDPEDVVAAIQEGDVDGYYAPAVASAMAYYESECYAVHCHATLAAAKEYAAEYGGEIIEIDTDGLDVRDGAEYPHPVVPGAIPSDRCRKIEGETK